MMKKILFLLLTAMALGSGNIEVSDERLKVLSADGAEAIQVYRTNTQNFLNWTTTAGDTTLFLIGGPVDLAKKGMTNVGNLTQVGNITGDDINIDAGTGDYTSTGTITADSIAIDSVDANSVTVEDLTETRVVFAGAGGLLVDDADMTFVTDTLTCTTFSDGTASLTGGVLSGLTQIVGNTLTFGDGTLATITHTYDVSLAPTLHGYTAMIR
jgi:hypothetical protein